MPIREDVIGHVYGRLTVISELPERSKQRYLLCQCVCGNRIEVWLGDLRRKHTLSCGCLQRERASQSAKTHGKAKTREYKIWLGMRNRCQNPKSPAFKYYGGRGIVICERWNGDNGFENFLEDMGLPPNPLHTLDRIDSNGNYEPSNCRWADRATQSANRTSNHYITFNGEIKTMSDWARSVNLEIGTLKQRLKNGWSIEAALTTPLMREGRRK